MDAIKSNCIAIYRFLPFFRYFAYFDTDNNVAHPLFAKHKVRVRLCREFCKRGSDYKLVFCKVRRKDVHGFLNAINEMSNKMLIMGHVDYDNFCQSIITQMGNAPTAITP